MLLDDGHHFLSEKSISRHELDFTRRLDLRAKSTTWRISSALPAQKWKSDLMDLLLDGIDLGSIVLHFNMINLRQLLSLSFIFLLLFF